MTYPLAFLNADALNECVKYIDAPQCERFHEIKAMPAVYFSPGFKWICGLCGGIVMIRSGFRVLMREGGFRSLNDDLLR